MRVLLSTYGSRGDVEPLVGLAVALKALGAEAVVSAPGDQEFVDLTARAGVELAPAFMPVRDWIASALKSPGDITTYGRRMIGPQYEAIRAAAAGCDVIMATGLVPSTAAAKCVAELQGIEYFHVSLCPLYLPSHHHSPIQYPGFPAPPDVTNPKALWDLNAERMNALFGGPINEQRAALGLPAVEHVRDHVFTAGPFLASDPALWPWAPTDLSDAIQTGAWILADTRPLPADLLAFLEAGAPPVYVGFGSIALPSTRAAAEVAIRAARAQGRRIVLARGWADAAPLGDGGDCFLTGDVNQQALFPRVAAVVHHGGAGTTQAAARAGAPQVIVPQIADQPYWGRRVADLGVGEVHDGATPTIESLTPLLASALAPESRANATILARAFKQDGAATAARLLLDGKI